MAVAIRMPMPGQMTEECTVLQWFKKEGDTVVRGDPLFEIETDKSNMEIEAFDEGVLLRIDAPEGATVPVESIVAWIGQPGEEIPQPWRPVWRRMRPWRRALEARRRRARGTPLPLPVHQGHLLQVSRRRPLASRRPSASRRRSVSRRLSVRRPVAGSASARGPAGSRRSWASTRGA